jgi:DNA-binding response OmpR family regulator
MTAVPRSGEATHTPSGIRAPPDRPDIPAVWPADAIGERPLVLVADDDEDIRMLVTFRLERSGYEVLAASDGEEALELAVRHRPELAVLDLMMPKLDGYQLTRRLRELEETRRIPVILLTARAQDDDVARGFEAGADDYIRKPFSPQELGARVQAILGRR